MSIEVVNKVGEKYMKKYVYEKRIKRGKKKGIISCTQKEKEVSDIGARYAQ